MHGDYLRESMTFSVVRAQLTVARAYRLQGLLLAEAVEYLTILTNT